MHLATSQILRTSKVAVVAGVLLGLTACAEHFERLTTTVTWDPASRTFEVQRVLTNLSSKFFGCTDVQTCVDAADAMQRLDYAAHTPKMDFSSLMSATEDDREQMAKDMATSLVGQGDQPTWTKLAKGLVESKAYDVGVRYVRSGERLDAIITYRASADSKAATDTGVVLETLRKGKKRIEYLVVDAGKSVGGFTSDAPPNLLEGTYVERTTAGNDPETWWVLPKGTQTATVERFVDETAQPLFRNIAGLESAMTQAGLLGGGV